MLTRSHILLLSAALLIGLLARLPGVFWGANFPTGWQLHHIDEWTHLVNTENLIAPSAPPRWITAYPKGLAAHVAVPAIAMRALQGQLKAENPPDLVPLAIAGRVVTVLYGTLTTLVVYLLAKELFKDRRVALFSSWILALGGLHVTQSHFFVADVPSLFWLLLGLYVLLKELNSPKNGNLHYLVAAAFCFGVAVGVKFIVFGLPTLVLVVLLRKPYIPRVIYSSIFFLAGFGLINFGSYTPVDLMRTLTRGTNDPYVYNRLMGLVLYLVELPSIVSFPIVLLSILGAGLLLKRLVTARPSISQLGTIFVIVLLPLLVAFFLLVFKLDHFPRHTIPFIPWLAILSAVALARIADSLRTRHLHPVIVIAPLLLYLALFVFDGERVFLSEPRNEAALWVLENVEVGTQIYWRTPEGLRGYEHVHFPEAGRPPFLVIQMDNANHYLSGIGWRNSYPRDHRNVFDSESQARVDGLQAVFKGMTEYEEVVRFKEGYFMPEYNLANQLVGSRSRNYVSEIVIFEQRPSE